MDDSSREFRISSRRWCAWRELGFPVAYSWLRWMTYVLLEEARQCQAISHSTQVLFAVAPYPKFKEVHAMAESKRGTKADVFFGFVNIPLTQGDKKQITELDMTDESIVAWVGELLVEGYTVSAKVDSWASVPMVILKCVNPDLPDFGWCMSSRHRDLGVAFSAAYFKHETKTKGDWTNYRKPLDKGDVFD